MSYKQCYIALAGLIAIMAGVDIHSIASITVPVAPLGVNNVNWIAWVSATSGWAAAFAAAVTVIPLWMQVRQLRKQTSFSLGDEPPSLEIWTNNGAAVYRFRIANWNRRAFLIYQIRWIRAPYYPVPPIILVDIETDANRYKFSDAREIDRNGALSGWVVIEGWEDRSRRPEVKRFYSIMSMTPPATYNDPRLGGDAVLEVVGVFAGQAHRPVRLRAVAPTLVDITPSRDSRVRARSEAQLRKILVSATRSQSTLPFV